MSDENKKTTGGKGGKPEEDSDLKRVLSELKGDVPSKLWSLDAVDGLLDEPSEGVSGDGGADVADEDAEYFFDPPEEAVSESEEDEPAPAEEDSEQPDLGEEVFSRFADDPLFSPGYLEGDGLDGEIFDPAEYAKYEESVFGEIASRENDEQFTYKAKERARVASRQNEHKVDDGLEDISSGRVSETPSEAPPEAQSEAPSKAEQGGEARDSDSKENPESFFKFFDDDDDESSVEEPESLSDATFRPEPLEEASGEGDESPPADTSVPDIRDDAIGTFFSGKPPTLPETEKSAAHFKKVLQLDKTAEQDMFVQLEPIERPGLIVEQSGASTTSDLQKIPTLIAAEDALRASRESEKTKVNGSVARGEARDEPESELDGQLVFSGFGEEERADSISEDEIEDELLRKRHEKVRRFRLFDGFEEDGGTDDAEMRAGRAAPYAVTLDEVLDDSEQTESGEEPDAEQEDYSTLEYRSPADRKKTGIAIQTLRRKNVLSALFLTAVELALILLIVIPALISRESIDAGVFDVDGSVNLIVSLMLLAAAAGVCLPCLTSGVRAVAARRPNSDSMVTLGVILCAINSIVAIIMSFVSDNPAAHSLCVYPAAAVLALLINLMGRAGAFVRMLGNFKFCAYTHADDLYAVRRVDNPKDVSELGRGLLMREPDIRVSSKIKFPSRFVELSRVDDLPDKLCSALLPAIAGGALLMFALGWFKGKSPVTGLSAMTGAFMFALPVSGLFSVNRTLRAVCRRLNSGGAMLLGLSAAEECGRVNAVAVDAAELFDSSACEFHGMKNFNTVRIDDVLLYAAAMMIRSGGPLCALFDEVIGGKRELLPPVKSLGYEDKLGLSAWINRQKVFMGNRSLLVNHNIEVPSKNAEMQYTINGRRVIYLAIANKPAAMFVVSYAGNDKLAAQMKSLEESGVTLLVRTCDSNVTEDMVAEAMKINPTCVKVLSAYAGRVFKRTHDGVLESADADVLHTGSLHSALKSVTAAISITAAMKTLNIIQIISVCLGWLTMLLLFVTTGFTYAGAIVVALYYLLWTAVAAAASGLRSGTLSR